MAVGYGQVNKYAKYGQPTLDLQFSGPKGSLNDRVGNVVVEFTRTQDTQASYVKSDGTIGYASTDVPRFDHDPTTGESLGLLIEEARTNGDTNSATLSNWGATNATFADQVITAPDGSTTAKLLTEDTSTGSHQISENYDNIYTGHALSFFVKPNGRTKFRIRLDSTAGGQPVDFDLANMTVDTSTPGAADRSGSIQEFANGWFRISAVTTGNFRGYCNFRLLDDSGNGSYTGDGTSGVYIWGVQYEKASPFSTSYIPTSGSTSTRGADVAQITGAGFSSFYNQSEGTWFTDMALGFTQNAGNPFKFGGVFYTVVTGIGAVRTLGNQTVMSGLSTSQTIPSKTTVALKSQDFKVYRDGVETGSNTSLVYTPTGTELSINPSLGAKGHISRITYWPTRLPDSDLQSLTE